MTENEKDDCPIESNSRRHFLQHAALTAAGAVAGLAALTAQADDMPEVEKVGPQDKADGDDLVLRLKDHPALAKVGGFTTLETAAGKIVVARAGEDHFAACAAVCPHKGGPIDWDPDKKDFFCPWHGSRFAADGTVTHGPARVGIKSYASNAAAVVELQG